MVGGCLGIQPPALIPDGSHGGQRPHLAPSIDSFGWIRPAETKGRPSGGRSVARRKIGIVPISCEERRQRVLLPPLRTSEFWFRALMVLKAIYDLSKIWKSL